MKKFGYGWLLKWILAAILVAVGLYFKFNTDLVYLVTGIFVVIFSVFRVFPLLKSLNKEVLRTINLIEIIFTTILGVALIVVGIKAKDGNLSEGLGRFVYKYSLVFIFAVRSIVFFYSTVFLEEKTEQVKFWTHIFLLPLAGVIAFNKDFDAEWVGWLLLGISLLGSVYLVYDGAKGYNNYRNEQKLLNQDSKPKGERTTKEIEEEQSVIIDKQDDERPYVS